MTGIKKKTNNPRRFRKEQPSPPQQTELSRTGKKPVGSHEQSREKVQDKVNAEKIQGTPKRAKRLVSFIDEENFCSFCLVMAISQTMAQGVSLKQKLAKEPWD